MTAFSARVTYLFQQSREAIATGCASMHAKHAATGLLASGNTARQAVAIFEQETAVTVRKAGAEAAGVIDSRGRAWRQAMAEISVALEQQVTMAPEMLASSMQLARVNRSGGTSRAVQRLIDEAADRLRSEISAFEDGWTAPQPKLWTERHPVIYAIVLLIAGSVIGAAVSVLIPSAR